MNLTNQEGTIENERRIWLIMTGFFDSFGVDNVRGIRSRGADLLRVMISGLQHKI